MSTWNRYRTYTLRVMAAPGDRLSNESENHLQRVLSHAEDVINDRLPEGFYVKIDEGSEGVDLAAVEDLERMARDGT